MAGGSSESSGAGGGRARGSPRQAGGRGVQGAGSRVWTSLSAEGRHGEAAHSKQVLDRGCRVSE